MFMLPNCSKKGNLLPLSTKSNSSSVSDAQQYRFPNLFLKKKIKFSSMPTLSPVKHPSNRNKRKGGKGGAKALKLFLKPSHTWDTLPTGVFLEDIPYSLKASLLFFAFN